jgi:ABC-type nitrate/sulfonate/bicarbonate transport system substrate-binding protein
MASTFDKSDKGDFLFSRPDRRRFLKAAGATAAIMSAGMSRSFAQGTGKDKWRIATPVFKADSMFQNMAIQKGFFADEGIDAEITGLESSATITRAVLAGELEMGSCGANSPMVAIARGGPLRMIGSVFARVPHIMYANSAIKEPKDLEGKNVGGAQPGALLQQLAYASLQESGVDLTKVKFVNTGGSPATFQAVVAGLVSAGVAGSEYALTLKADPSIKVHALYKVSEKLPLFLRNADFVNVSMLSDKKDLALRAARAYIKGMRFALANKDEAVQWAVDNAKVTKDVAEAVWHEYVDDHFVNAEYLISPEQIEFTQKVNIESKSQTSMVKYDDMVDTTIAKEALASL